MKQIRDKYIIGKSLGKGKTSFVHQALRIEQPQIQVAIKEYKEIRNDEFNQDHPLYIIFQKEAYFLSVIESIIDHGMPNKDFQHINRILEILKQGNLTSNSFLLVLEFAIVVSYIIETKFKIKFQLRQSQKYLFEQYNLIIKMVLYEIQISIGIVYESEIYYNLIEFLNDNTWIPKQIASAYMLQLTKAVKILHDFNVAHMDIKPENMLVDENFILKLTDFGMIEYTHESIGIQGTKGFMAPEVSNGGKYLTKNADIFSLGCTFVYIRSGLYPFGAGHMDMYNPYYVALLKEPHEFWIYFEKFVKYENNVEITFEEEFKDLIERMLHYLPDKRPTIDEVLKHPYLNIYKLQQISEKALQDYLKAQFIIKGLYQLTQNAASIGSGVQANFGVMEVEQTGLNEFRFRSLQNDKNFYKTVTKFFNSIIAESSEMTFDTNKLQEHEEMHITQLIKNMDNSCKLGVIVEQENDVVTINIIGIEGTIQKQNKLKKQIRDQLKSKIKKQDQQNI